MMAINLSDSVTGSEDSIFKFHSHKKFRFSIDVFSFKICCYYICSLASELCPLSNQQKIMFVYTINKKKRKIYYLSGVGLQINRFAQ